MLGPQVDLNVAEFQTPITESGMRALRPRATVVSACAFKSSTSTTAVTTMPEKVITTQYPLIDADPHAGRVIRYFRLSDYAVWTAATGAFPAALYLWGM